MRFEVVKTIYNAACQDKNIYFITGDLGHVCEEDFKKNIPNQYINTGLAEQNMIGVASGLALSGMKVFVYSIIPFAVMRCYEQIRNDVCYQNLDVTIIGVGAGFAYSTSGYSHYGIEDISIMRVLPNMNICCPANPLEARILTEQILKTTKPHYLRIGRGGEPNPDENYPLSQIHIGKALKIKEGKDITLFTTGTILEEAIQAAENLEKNNVSVEIINLHTMKPMDFDFIAETIKSKKGIFTIEEHSIIGGLGGAIAEIISESNKKDIIFKRFGVGNEYNKQSGSQNYFRNKHGISSEKIPSEILKLINM